MKKKIAILSAFALILSLLSMGSLAYFTHSHTTRNEITSGSIRIEINDLTVVDEALLPLSLYEGIMPGDSIQKRVYVTNTGGNDAWIRLRVTSTWDDDLPGDPFTLGLNLTEWTQVGDWYYYHHVVAPGGDTDVLVNAVSFPITLDNSYQSQTFELDFEAEAVQHANNGADVFAAFGWPTP